MDGPDPGDVLYVKGSRTLASSCKTAGRWIGTFSIMALCAACATAAVAEATAAPLRHLAVDDFLALERVRRPVISPDGELIAYAVETTDAERNERGSAVWSVPSAGDDPLRMTSRDRYATVPRWSPDGAYLSFLSVQDDEASQVWVLNRSGGEAQQLTAVQQGVEAYEWSPDGGRLVLVIRDPISEEIGKYGQDAGGAEIPGPWVIDRLQFKRQGVGYLDRRRTHLYIFDVATKQLTQVTDGDFDDSEPAWAPGSRSIAFVSNRTEEPDANYNTDIWLVQADDPGTDRALRQLTTSPGQDGSPVWNPDGSKIAYVTSPNIDEVPFYAMEQVAIISVDGGQPTILTTRLDRRVGSPRFAPDGDAVYFRLEDQRSVHLGRVPATGGDITRVIAGERCVNAYAVGLDGALVTLVSTSHTPGNLFVADTGRLRQLTRHNNALLNGIELAEVEPVSFASRDGTEIQGFIYQPPDYTSKERYPTLLRIHGGPWSQYDFRFNFEAQLFAANGYVVVMTNPRGSTGRGKDFRMGIWQSWGVRDTEDVLAGIDHAIELGYADSNRLGVGGWSYGGILTNYVIGHTDRFKAAVSGASYALYAANYGHDHHQRWWEREFGLPWEGRELWESRSSFNNVQNIVTPTLWMVGEKDWSAPAINSEQMYQAMKRLGRETLLVVYPNQPTDFDHHISLPSYRKDLLERELAWYGKYLSE